MAIGAGNACQYGDSVVPHTLVETQCHTPFFCSFIQLATLICFHPVWVRVLFINSP